MSQASCSCSTSHVVLDEPQLGDDPRELGVAGVVGGDRAVDRGGEAAVHAGLGGPAQGAGELVDVAHRQAQRGRHLGQRRTATGPQLAVLAVAEELVGLPRGARAGVEHGLAARLDDQHGVAGLVAAEVGVRGVRAEAVVGVVAAHLVRARRQHEALAGECRRQRRAPSRGVLGDGVGGQVQLALAPARSA